MDLLTCSRCKADKPGDQFYFRPNGHKRGPCKACEKSDVGAWRAANPQHRNATARRWQGGSEHERHRQFVYSLRWRWNLTEEQYDAMLVSQSGGCAICHTSDPGGGRGRFCIDHNHACCPDQSSCGLCVRGLLCLACNRALGLLRDDAARFRSAATYLEDHPC